MAALDSPVVHQDQGFSFEMYFNEPEHEGPHVHVLKGRGYGSSRAKFTLLPVKLVKVRGRKLSPRDLKAMTEIIEDNLDELLRKWDVIKRR